MNRVGVDSACGDRVTFPTAQLGRNTMTPAMDGSRQLSNRFVPLAEPVVVTAPEAVTPRRWVTARTAVVALVALGVALRLVALLSDRCLWIDEAMLALNL